MLYPETINNLIEFYKKFPGIGEKSAERMALYSLQLDQEVIDIFAKSLTDLKKNIKRCRKCNNLSQDEICPICQDENRDQQVICVVEEPKNVFQFEKIGSRDAQQGVFHGGRAEQRGLF